MARLVALVERRPARQALDLGARPRLDVGVHCLAGADYPADVRLLERGARGEPALTRAGRRRQRLLRRAVGRVVDGAGASP